MVEIVNEVEGNAEVGKETPKDLSAENRLEIRGGTEGFFIAIFPFRAAAALDKVFAQDSEEKEEMETEESK